MKLNKNNSLSIFGVLVLILGIAAIVLAILVTPTFAANHLSSDHDLTSTGIKLLNKFRIYSSLLGILLIFAGSFLTTVIRTKLQQMLAFFHINIGSYSKACWRIINVIFYGGVFILLLKKAYSLLTSGSTDPFLIGDWLINYQGGIVRRGLLGELFLKASQNLGINSITMVVVLQVILYLIFLIFSFRLSLKSSFSVINAVIIFSPAFILFPVLDPPGAFRKEILLFALLAPLCWYLSSYADKYSKGLPFIIGIASIILVLTHEMLVVYLPYLICAFVIHEKGLSGNVKRIIVSIIPAIVLSIILIVFFRGDMQVVKDICTSLKVSAPQDCNTWGAIASLGTNIRFANNLVIKSNNTRVLPVYALTSLLGFGPLILFFFSNQFKFQINRSIRYWLSIFIFSTIFCSLPFFWIVADYGRLIYIHITCLSLLALMINYERNNDVALPFNFKTVSSWGLGFLFITSWRLIHYSTSFDKAFPLIHTFEHFYEVLIAFLNQLLSAQ